MRKFLNGWRGLLVAVALFLCAGVAWAASGDVAAWGRVGSEWWRITSAGDLVPGVNGTRNLGSSTLKVGNISVVNIAIAGTYSTDNIGATSNVTAANAILSSALNVTGTSTLNAVVGNSTLNTTGLLTANNVVANSTVNVTGLLSLSAGLAYGGTSVNASNITLTSSNATHVYLTNMTGNHTITLPAVSTCTGRQFRVIEVCNKWGGTGNVTFNVTSGGNVNLVDAYTPTNTSGASGNISQVIAECNGGYWSVGVIRR